jgi:hypothetical protein
MSRSEDSSFSFECEDMDQYAKFAEEKIEGYEESINNCYINIKALINHIDENYKAIDLSSKICTFNLDFFDFMNICEELFQVSEFTSN